MSDKLTDVINKTLSKLDGGQSRRIYLKPTELVRVVRTIKFLSNATNVFETTAGEAIKDKDFDTCNGTVNCRCYTAVTGHRVSRSEHRLYIVVGYEFSQDGEKELI